MLVVPVQTISSEMSLKRMRGPVAIHAAISATASVGSSVSGSVA